MKVVLDTNVLVSGIFWKGAPYNLLRAWAENRFEVIVNKAILTEYLTVLHRIDVQGDIAKRWSVFLLEQVIVVKDRYRIRLVRDASDDKFINAALSGNADFIISGDDDLLSLQDRCPISIVNPRKFFDLLRKRQYGAQHGLAGSRAKKDYRMEGDTESKKTTLTTKIILILLIFCDGFWFLFIILATKLKGFPSQK